MAASPPTPGTGTRREIVSWCLFDFANSSFTTLVVTFIYPIYFNAQMVGDEIRGTLLWSRAISTTAVLVAILSPILGSLADLGGRRKRYLVAVSLTCVAGTAGLALLPPGGWRLSWLVFVAANLTYEMSQVLYNSYLPDLAPPERMGRISGYGWGAGYVGGLLCLVIALPMTGLPGILEPQLPTAGGWNVRATNLLVAAWFLTFSLPLFLFVRERPGARAGRGRATVGGAFRELVRTARQLGRFRHAARFLLARLIYNDGLVTLFAFGALFASKQLDMPLGEVILLGIWLNVSAGLGAALMGHLDDRLGGKRTVVITLVVLIASAALGAAAPSKIIFWIAATGIGFMVGPNQAASRSLMGRFAPDGQEGEFFGFFAFSGKLTSFLGPLLLGQITAWTGSHRLGIASVIAFFAVGLVLLLAVDEKAGAAQATAAGPAT